MQDEATWMSGQSADVSAAKERYEYFTRPEPRENLSDIYTIDDPYLGPNTKVREVRVGMTRNAADENRKDVIAYLEPFPHIRIEKAKQLQGWYQSKENESKQSRPRPCFTEAILTEPYGGYCLPPASLIETPRGPKPIESLEIGDMVLGKDGGRVVLAEVLNTIDRWCDEGLVVVETVSGESVPMTADHPVYSLSRADYIRAGDLYVGEKIETRSVQELRAAGDKLADQHVGVLSGLSVLTGPNGGPRGGQGGPGYGRMDLRPAGVRGAVPDEDRRPVCGMCRRSPTEPRTGQEGRDVITGRDSEDPGSQGQAIGGADREEAFGRNQGQVCGERPPRTQRPEAVQEKLLHLSEGAGIPAPFVLGAISSGVSGPQEIGLGLRTTRHPTTERHGLPSGFRPSERDNHRGEGVHGLTGPEQDRGNSWTGIPRGSVRRSETEGYGDTVAAVRRLTTPLRVYDIQTTTENFYVRGQTGRRSFQVHNCAVGCQFCYINSGMRGYRGTGLISVPLDYGSQIKDQLKKMRRSAAGYFSSFTDPFTPLEAYYHNTENAAREFVNVGLPIFFLSRLRYPSWAIDMLCENPHSYAQKSINTSDPVDWRRLSPGAMSLEAHLDDIRRIKKRGIYVSIQVNPIVPGITSNDQIIKLFGMLKKAGANHVITKFVEAAYSWAPAMVERMKKVFGKERGGAFERLFTQNIGAERTVDEAYRMEGHRVFSAEAKRLGLTYSTCYEYAYERNPDGSIKSKTGVSIGRQYATSSQCHGQAVPMYTRENENEMFRPVEECPPSGCLYCADENNGEPRCGDELAGEAKALKFSDFKLPIGQGKASETGLIQLGLKPRK